MARTSPTMVSYAGGFLICDAVLDAQIEATAELTEHAVESGSSVSDHLIHKPLQLTMTLVSTDTPIYAEYLSPKGDVLGRTGVATDAVSAGFRNLTPRTQQTTELKVRKSQGQQLNVSAAITAAVSFVKSKLGAADPTSITGRGEGLVELNSLAVNVLSADAPVDRIHDFYESLLKLMLTSVVCSVTFKGREYKNLVFVSVTKSDAAGQFGRSTFPVQLRELLTVETRQTALPAVPKQKQKKDRGAQQPKALNEAEKKTVDRSFAAQSAIDAGAISENTE